LRIDSQRQRFVVSVSERDVLRLICGGELTSVAVRVEGIPVGDHALTLRLERDQLNDDTAEEPLPPAQEHLKSWLFRVVRQEVEMPEMWLDTPKLAFGRDGQLCELTHHRSGYLAMERVGADVVVFDVDRIQVQVIAVAESGEARLHCWAGDHTGQLPFDDLVIQGDEARRLFDSGR
jgi:hypothetical protein